MLKNFKIFFSILISLLITPSFAQTNVSSISPVNWKDTIQSRSYQLLSGFDTISRKPLRVFAWYMMNNKFGLIDENGRVITNPLYDGFPDIENEYGNSIIFPSRPYIRVVSDGLYGLIDYEGKEILPTKYTYIKHYTEQKDVGHDSTPYRPIFKVSFKWYQIDSVNVRLKMDANGNIFERKIIPTKKNDSEDNEYGEMSGSYGRADMIRMPDSDSYSVTVSRTSPPMSKEFIKLTKQYEENEVFNTTTRKYGLVNKYTRDTLIPVEYDMLHLDRYGRIIAKKNIFEYDSKKKQKIYKGSLMAIYTMKGKVLFPLKYKEIDLFNGIYLLNKEGKIAIYDSMLKPVSKHIYDEKMGSSNSRVMSLAINGKYALFNLNGKPFTAFEYDKIVIPDKNGLPFPMIIASKNGKDAIMDYSGKLYTGFEYDRIIAECHVSSDGGIKLAGGFHSNQLNTYFYVKQNNLWGIMDTNYKLILPCMYEDIGKCYDKEIIFVCQNKKWGIMELKTQKIIYPIELTRKPDMKSEFFVVFKGENYGVVKKDGTIVHNFTLTTSPIIEKVYKGLYKIISYNYNSIYTTIIDYYGNGVSYSELRESKW